MLKKISLIAPLLFVSLTAKAWLCPNNFSTINPGDSLENIKALCGPPITETKTMQEPDVPQEWGYYVKVNPPNPATIRVSIVIVDKKVANITVNAMSLVSTSLCGGTISIGQSAESLKATCGSPMFVTKQPAKPGQKPTEVNELTYTGQPPNILVFENGILKERK